MNIRLKCPCGARLTTSDQLRGRMVRCPKCHKALRVPDAMAAQTSGSAALEEATEFITTDPQEIPAAANQPADTTELRRSANSWQSLEVPKAPALVKKRRAWLWTLLALLLLVPLGVVCTLLALPYFRPKDPRELVAQRYLDAVRREDFAEANRLSVVTTHPRLVGVQQVALAEQPASPLRGKFRGLRQFHDEIDQQYRYNSDRGRFEPKDELGLGLNVLSQIEEAKKKVEQEAASKSSDQPKKRQSPEEQLLDDALAAYGAIGELASRAGGLLSSPSLGPTYDDLLNKSNVPLSDAERALAKHFGRDPAKWQRLLGRSFLELPDAGDFELWDVELHATIRTEGQSLGEPGRPLKLRLVRFTMGSIDTGWRVWVAE